MFASTNKLESDIPESVRSLFAEVSVFFAAMTKAISSTNNPLTSKPYSIYNYDALAKVINRSGLFIHVNQSDYTHKSKSFGLKFSKELLEGLLGLATGAGAMSFAQGMLASMGKEGLNIARTTDGIANKVANIVFVCEYLLGMPSISAIVVYCDTVANKSTFDFGPCINVKESDFSLTMHKDTYLFVTPQFVREYSSDLASVSSNADFNEFVDYLQAILTDTPRVIDVFIGDTDTLATSPLASGGNYRIAGVNLQAVDKIRRRNEKGANPLIIVGNKSANSISITVRQNAVEPNGDILPSEPMDLFDTSDVLLTSTKGFTIGPPVPPNEDPLVLENDSNSDEGAIAAPPVNAPLGFTAGKGVNSASLVSFINAVDSQAEAVSEGIIKELKKGKITAKLKNVKGVFYILCGNNDLAEPVSETDQITIFVDPVVNINITANAADAPAVIDALNRFFSNWQGVAGLIAVGAAAVLGTWLLRVDPAPPPPPPAE